MINALVVNPRLMIMAIALIMVAGFSSFNQLAQTEDPAFKERFAAVITAYPGGTAERVESLITEPLESTLRQLDEIKRLESASRPGFSRITIELNSGVIDTEAVWSKVRALSDEKAATFPRGTSQPRLDTQVSAAFTRILALRWVGPGTIDISALGRYGETLANRLRRVIGTDYVKVHGRQQEQILVEIGDAQMQSLGLTTDHVAAIIAASDSKGSSGRLSNDNVRAQVELAGELDSLERIRQVPLRLGDQQQGVRLGDVADVRRALYTPSEDSTFVNGQPAVLVAARMLPHVRVDRWDPKVDAQLEQLQKQLPSNVVIETLFNQRHYTELRLQDLAINLAQGFALIVIVLLITLGLRSALLVATALPLTVLITLTCMQFYGLPIHQMSVVGLVVALGIMVDNAIVIVDAIAQRKRQGLPPVEAVRRTLQHFWLPLLASTLTTVLAFAPIFLMPGPAGEFVGGIALAVSFALLASYAVSHTLIAGLSGRFVSAEAGAHWWQNGIQLPGLINRAKGGLQFALARPKTTIVLVMCLPLFGFWSATQLDEQFFPPSDRDMFQIQLWLPPSASHVATEKLMLEMDGWIRSQEGIKQTSWDVGRNMPSFYYNLRAAQRGVSNFAHGMITAVDYQRANQLIPLFQNELSARYPQAQILVRKLEQGPPFNAPVELRLIGDDFTALDRAGEELRLMLQQQPQVTHTRVSLQTGLPRVKLTLDEQAVRAAGLNLAEVTAQLSGNLDGSIGGTVLEGPESIPVRVRLSADAREASSDLANLPLSTPSGKWLTISALGNTSIESSRSEIPRRNGERINTVMAYLQSGVLPSTVLNRVQQQMAEQSYQLPSGTRLEIGGESAERDDAVGQLLSSVAFILVLLVTIVALSFNSFRLTVVILASAFQSVGLGLFSIFLGSYPFGFNTMIGLMGLMGLAINAAIVILAELEQSPAARQGDVDATITAIARCGRHISSTTITTIGGFLPLILAGGGFWPPFAIAIAGGTLLTTLLSFLFVPAAYRLSRRWGAPQDKAPSLAAAA
ncbi:efflux RND transporter permease subunit [Ferrimonas lipolytica]|uniref:Efflux RND transporter permease subunit n=1 Tax=Ferrimonas lipolytica TaxID=2724191 RepID=A0A6H1UE43_9GAMM|nr:efflux RND transporter permease subunit [Ferrimonas lipolytica]QIZ77098.1 efflux RND transporter permease subunit [Ferrimonas lipolytica]